MSDNGPQFSCAEFTDFAKVYRFNHKTSSPYFSQSNGKIESAVKIVKSLLKKSLADDSDFMLALLDGRNTPTPLVNSSPVQCMMSRRIRLILPIDPRLLYPKVIANVQSDLMRKRQKAKQYYDRSSSALLDLNKGDVVRIQPITRGGTLELAKCIRKVASRSYLLECNGRVFRRNRKFLKLTKEKYVPFDFNCDSNCADNNQRVNDESNENSPSNGPVLPIALRRPIRNCGPPDRYGHYVTHS